MSVPVQPEESITAVENGYICASRDVRMLTRSSFPKIDLLTLPWSDSSCLPKTLRFDWETLFVTLSAERTFLAKSSIESLSSSILRSRVLSSLLVLSPIINARGKLDSFLRLFTLYSLSLGKLFVVFSIAKSKQIRKCDSSITVCVRTVLSQLLSARGYIEHDKKLKELRSSIRKREKI